MKTIRRLLSWLLPIGALAAAGILMTKKEPPTITAYTIGRGPVEATVANTRAGTVTANRRAKLAPSAGGQVERLLVKEGDRVAKGQVLLELWRGDLEAQLALARSEGERAAAMADQARLQAEFAEREAKRQQDLQEQDISAGGAVDRVVSAASAARAAERAAEADAASKQNHVRVIEAQITRMTVVAPFAGIVAEVNGEVGEFVTPSPVGIPTPPAVDLIDDGVPYVTAPIDEVDAARVQVGMTARVTLDAFGKRVFAGRVRRIAPYVLDREKQARTVDVEVEFVEPTTDAQLLPGYSADVEILVATRASVLRVPTETVREGSVVLVVQPGGVLAARTIGTGLANWRFTEVTSGLVEGDRIVASFDQKGLDDGVVVAIAGANGKP
ncbi:MAG TPA: efflux RND transporter periplasmic adaptor subunit [Planctomycetota bacterium]|nr:efflux RND transporter periplasmic adaptor subunit [Planctomycetota bacterium]